MSTTDYKPAAKVSDFHLFGRPGGVYINELILRPLRRAETAKVGYINELLLRPLRRAETAKVGLERQITISRVHKFSAAKFFLEESNIDFQIHEESSFLHGLVLSERFGVNVKSKKTRRIF